jgi:hypothetical protein
LTLTGEGQSVTVLDKCVLTVFLSKPKSDQCTAFAEICTASGDPFRVSMSGANGLQGREDLYLDFQACTRLFSGYDLKNNRTGEHSQRVGEHVLSVVPSAVEITDVSPTTSRESRLAFHVAFAAQPEENKHVGSWLQWTQTTPFGIVGVNPRFCFSLRTENLRIETFYAFLVLPLPYRSLDPTCVKGDDLKI